MQDGANDDWLLEGEATPILMNSYGSDSDLGRHGGGSGGGELRALASQKGKFIHSDFLF